MNYAFLPDLSALTILIMILLVLRRRHPQEQSGVWLLGLSFTLVEAIAHTFYAPDGLPSKILHVIVLDCYLLAGLTFNWAAGDQRRPRGPGLLYLCLNALPLLIMDTLYGLHFYTPSPYLLPVVSGIVLGIGSSLLLRRSWLLSLALTLGWVGIALLIRRGEFREAVYWSLACVYLITAFNFGLRLPRSSTGRLAIQIGFFIWALCFLLHPWVVHYRAYADIASHVWNMQKSLISIGMLLVMLERQVANNEWLALHDELTGLPNRRLFDDRMAEAVARCRNTNSRLAMFLLDLNGFKAINDSLGHQAGDQVLQQLASNLREAVGTSGTLARLGGDEFVLMACEDHRPRIIESLTEDIRGAVRMPLLVDGATLHITASLGVAIYPDDANNSTRLLGVADQRMYTVKQTYALQPDLKGDLASTR